VRCCTKTLPQRVSAWTPKGIHALGCDGFGRSETRDELRRFFETDAASTAYAALYELSKAGQFDAKKLAAAMRELKIDAEAVDPSKA